MRRRRTGGMAAGGMESRRRFAAASSAAITVRRLRNSSAGSATSKSSDDTAVCANVLISPDDSFDTGATFSSISCSCALCAAPQPPRCAHISTVRAASSLFAMPRSTRASSSFSSPPAENRSGHRRSDSARSGHSGIRTCVTRTSSAASEKPRKHAFANTAHASPQLNALGAPSSRSLETSPLSR